MARVGIATTIMSATALTLLHDTTQATSSDSNNTMEDTTAALMLSTSSDEVTLVPSTEQTRPVPIEKSNHVKTHTTNFQTVKGIGDFPNENNRSKNTKAFSHTVNEDGRTLIQRKFHPIQDLKTDYTIREFLSTNEEIQSLKLYLVPANSLVVQKSPSKEVFKQHLELPTHLYEVDVSEGMYSITIYRDVAQKAFLEGQTFLLVTEKKRTNKTKPVAFSVHKSYTPVTKSLLSYNHDTYDITKANHVKYLTGTKEEQSKLPNSYPLQLTFTEEQVTNGHYIHIVDENGKILEEIFPLSTTKRTNTLISQNQAYYINEYYFAKKLNTLVVKGVQQIDYTTLPLTEDKESTSSPLGEKTTSLPTSEVSKELSGNEATTSNILSDTPLQDKEEPRSEEDTETLKEESTSHAAVENEKENATSLPTTDENAPQTEREEEGQQQSTTDEEQPSLPSDELPSRVGDELSTEDAVEPTEEQEDSEPSDNSDDMEVYYLTEEQEELFNPRLLEVDLPVTISGNTSDTSSAAEETPEVTTSISYIRPERDLRPYAERNKEKLLEREQRAQIYDQTYSPTFDASNDLPFEDVYTSNSTPSVQTQTENAQKRVASQYGELPKMNTKTTLIPLALGVLLIGGAVAYRYYKKKK